MKPTFQVSTDPVRVVIHDPIQGRQFPIRTCEGINLSTSNIDQFLFPVDSAAVVETDHVTLPFVVAVYVRNMDGELVTDAEHFAYEELPSDEYIFELMAPIKIYLRVKGPVTIASSVDHMRIDFGECRLVEIGARSNHHRPGTTVTTTADPTDLMAAVSTFGSALKTTSPERSLPSLRGHPPRLKLGDKLQIPDVLSSPKTGIRIELPPERKLVYTASTLAYYLGATIVPGSTSQVIIENEDAYPLSRSGRDFERDVEHILEQTFLLDCATRTEGLYQIDLHEREVLDDRIDLDWPAVYDMTPADRLKTYLSIPYEEVADLVPTWRLMTYVEPNSDCIKSLPFIVNGLSMIRSVNTESPSEVPSKPPSGIDEFFRSPSATTDSAIEKRSSGSSQSTSSSYVSLPSTDALEVAWVGEKQPVSANHLTGSGFENRIEKGRPADEVEITIVCNDPAMSAEYDNADRSLYGNRDELPFDITVHYDLSKEKLTDVLATHTDFLHYIGHSESDAFLCHDGRVDANNLDHAGPHTFLLNGCTSYEQGIHLLESGSVGGIVTHSDVGNEDATAIGQSIARLLNVGFSLRSALVIARDRRIVGTQYLVVGDGGAQVAQNEGGTPVQYHIDSQADGDYKLTIITYPTVEAGLGAMYLPHIDGVDTHYLTGGRLPSFTLSDDEFHQFLTLEEVPVVFEGEPTWSIDLNLQ